MSVRELLRIAGSRLSAVDAEATVDTAVRAYALADDPAVQADAALAVARGTAALGLPADAIVWCDRVLAVAPGDRAALTCRGAAHIALGRTAEGLADLDGGTDPPAVLARVRALDGLGRRDEADAELDRRHGALTAAARTGDRDALAALLRRGELPDDPAVGLTRLRTLDDPDEARAFAGCLLARHDLDPIVRGGALVQLASLVDDRIPLLSEAAALVPGDPVPLTELGLALYEADRDGDAQEVLERAVALGATDGRAERLLGDLHACAERWATAEEWYAQAMRHDPRGRGALFGRAQALLRLDREKEACELAVRAAIAGDRRAEAWCRDNELPTPGLVYETASWLYESMDNPVAADQNYRTAADLWLAHSEGPGDFCARQAARALARAARCRCDLGDAAGAERQARRAIELRPGLCAAWHVLGDALVREGRPAEALAAYERGRWCDPAGPDGYAGAAEALLRLGRGGDALAALDRAIAIGYGEQTARHNELYRRRARLYQALGRWHDALADLRYLLDRGGWNRWEWRDWEDGLRAVRQIVADRGRGGRTAPYRRYGLTRGGRHQGTWAYRLRLCSVPDEATRVRMARAAAGVIDPDRFDDSPPWLWSGPFVLVRLSPDGGTPDADTVETLDRVVDAVHRVAPLAEAVSLQAGGVDPAAPAEVWSIAAQPVPDAGPEFGVAGAFWVPAVGDTTAFPPAEVDPDVEAALHRGAAEILRRRADERAAESAAAVEAGQLVLVPVAEDAVPKPCPDAVPLPELSPSPDVLAVSPDGGRALYARNGARDLWFVELAGGRTWEVLADLPKVTALAFLDSGDVMVKTDAWLAVYAVDRDRLVRLAAQETEVGPAVAWGGGRLLITSTVEAPELVVFGWYDGVLSRLADLSAPVNCYRVHVADGRAFAADRIPFEIVNLAPAWERFAAWVRERRCARQQADGLVVDEVASAPSHGIWAAPPAVREAADWYVTGPAGRTFALKRTGERYAALAGDVRGVRPFRPPLVARTFPYDWRPDGTAVLAYIGGRLVEADLAAGTARPLLDGAECFCYTAEGCAVVRQGSLVLYRWPHGTPTRPVRAGTVVLPYIGRVSYLGWADHGRVLHITIGGRTCFLAVHEGRLYPVGALRAREWFHVWARGEALYLQNTDEASGVPLRLYRVTGFDRAVAAALAGGPVERLVPDDLPPVFLSTSEYPGRTRWRLDGADVGFDDDVDEDDDY